MMISALEASESVRAHRVPNVAACRSAVCKVRFHTVTGEAIAPARAAAARFPAIPQPMAPSPINETVFVVELECFNVSITITFSVTRNTIRANLGARV